MNTFIISLFYLDETVNAMKIDFLGIPVDGITMEETVSIIDDAIRTGQHINHVVINAGKVVLMQKDTELAKSVVSCDIINADGQSIVWAARFLGKKSRKEWPVQT